ncbi:MAG: hypothetical protein Q9195_006771 [Heterodermia aff. obscurata]
MADPLASSIPFDAWRNVDQLSISLGTLRLRRDEDIKGAMALLRELDFSDLMKLRARELQANGQSASASKGASDRKSSETVQESSSEEHSPLLKVSLRGVAFPPMKPGLVGVAGLHGRVEGNENVLYSLRRQLNLLFDKYVSPKTPSRVKSEVIDFGIMSTHILQSKAIASNGKGTFTRYDPLDLRELCDRYKDLVWAENVHLEQICLSPTALRDFYDKRQLVARAVYRDIARVALPGAPPPTPIIRKSTLNYGPAKLTTPPPTEDKV